MRRPTLSSIPSPGIIAKKTIFFSIFLPALSPRDIFCTPLTCFIVKHTVHMWWMLIILIINQTNNYSFNDVFYAYKFCKRLCFVMMTVFVAHGKDGSRGSRPDDGKTDRQKDKIKSKKIGKKAMFSNLHKSYKNVCVWWLFLVGGFSFIFLSRHLCNKYIVVLIIHTSKHKIKISYTYIHGTVLMEGR